eukprot:1033669-Prorocentrum_minimum.AAC.1
MAKMPAVSSSLFTRLEKGNERYSLQLRDEDKEGKPTIHQAPIVTRRVRLLLTKHLSFPASRRNGPFAGRVDNLTLPLAGRSSPVHGVAARPTPVLTAPNPPLDPLPTGNLWRGPHTGTAKPYTPVPEGSEEMDVRFWAEWSDAFSSANVTRAYLAAMNDTLELRAK